MAPPLLPSTRLLTCTACAEHVKAHETVCPHCGAELGGSRFTSTAAAVLMSLALACGGKGDEGTASTASTGTGDSTTGNTDDSSSGSSSSGVTSTAAESSESGTTQLPEPEYGVPATTTTTAEPDYGVPATEAETTADTGSTTEMTGTDEGTMGEPEYGVPGTSSTTTSTTTAEPDYGVPGDT